MYTKYPVRLISILYTIIEPHFPQNLCRPEAGIVSLLSIHFDADSTGRDGTTAPFFLTFKSETLLVKLTLTRITRFE